MTDRTMQRTHFWERGCDYYVAGRFAVHAGMNPVAGNILHHAIEFMLKGALSKSQSLADLRKHLHGLPKLWQEFKIDCGDTTLDRFDPLIAALHAYEDLRYPDIPLRNGMGSNISTHRSAPMPPELAALAARFKDRRDRLPQVTEYSLCLEDVDELVAAIFAAAKTNARFFFTGQNPKALEYLLEGNTVADRLLMAPNRRG